VGRCEDTPFPRIISDRIKAGQALPYLLDVADGKEKPVEGRVRVCLALLNKVVPDVRSMVMDLRVTEAPRLIMEMPKLTNGKGHPLPALTNGSTVPPE